MDLSELQPRRAYFFLRAASFLFQNRTPELFAFVTATSGVVTALLKHIRVQHVSQLLLNMLAVERQHIEDGLYLFPYFISNNSENISFFENLLFFPPFLLFPHWRRPGLIPFVSVLKIGKYFFSEIYDFFPWVFIIPTLRTACTYSPYFISNNSENISFLGLFLFLSRHFWHSKELFNGQFL